MYSFQVHKYLNQQAYLQVSAKVPARAASRRVLSYKNKLAAKSMHTKAKPKKQTNKQWQNANMLPVNRLNDERASHNISASTRVNFDGKFISLLVQIFIDLGRKFRRCGYL